MEFQRLRKIPPSPLYERGEIFGVLGQTLCREIRDNTRPEGLAAGPEGTERKDFMAYDRKLYILKKCVKTK